MSFHRHMAPESIGRSLATLSLGLAQTSKRLDPATRVQSISSRHSPKMRVTQNVHGFALAHFRTDGCGT